MMIIHTKEEYKNLIKKIEEILLKSNLIELKNFIGINDEIDIEYRPISSLSNKDFPKTINFKFQITDETFLSWETIQNIMYKLEKIHKTLKELLKIC